MKEYRRQMKEIRKAHREVIDNIQKFAKRSKHIEFKESRSWYGHCRIDLCVTGESKVTRELYEYLTSFCHFNEFDDVHTDWFHNYDTCEVRDYDDEDDEFRIEYVICVSKYKY